MGILVSCVLAHMLLARMAGSVWWVPDVTSAGLIMAVSRAPGQWFRLSMIAGIVAMSWAIRSSGPILVGYVVLGWLAWLVNSRWNAADVRLQALMAGGAALAIALEIFWLDDTGSLGLFALAGGRAVLTGLLVLLLYRIAQPQAQRP